MVEKTSSGRYEKATMTKMDAEANDIVLAALTKAWDFRARYVRLHRLDKPGVNSNGIINKTTGLLPRGPAGQTSYKP